MAEASEAGAYASLITAASLPGFEALDVNGATVLRSRAAPGAFIVNRVLGFGVSTPSDEAALEAVSAPFRQYDMGFALELAAPDPEGELLARLKKARLRRIAVAHVLLRDCTPPPPRYAAWALSSGLRVESVEADRAGALAALCVANFAVPSAVGDLIAAGVRGSGWRRWLALDGDQPVGGSLSFISDQVAWFGWTSVSPSHRGRRVHASIVARQLEDAAAAGCRWVTTETSRSTDLRPDPAYLNLRRFGFQDAYLRPSLACAPLRRPGP